jgi:4-hydroxybenzoate polyprenyltransferase
MIDMPSTLKKVLRFTKIEHSAFSLPLILSGAYLGAGGRLPSVKILLLVLLAAVGARIFGMAANRLFDRRIDALNPRTAGRELPSGQMSVKMALGIAMSGLFVYVIACASLGSLCLMLSPVPLIPLLGYSLLKRFTVLCHFGIGLCLALAPLGAYVASAGNLAFSLPAILLAVFVWGWMSGSDIIYAIMDIDSDRANKIFSLPAVMGRKAALQVAAGVHALALTSLVLIELSLGGSAGGWLFLGITASSLALMYVPVIPVAVRFFPIATIAGMAGAIVPMLG